MSEEEKDTLSPAPEPEVSGKENSKSAERPLTRGQFKRRKQSVFQYIAILFAAAFVLLLFTFVMERRQHQLLQEENQEQINNLQQSATAIQSLQNLYDENDALKEQVEELETQLSQAETDIASLRQIITSLELNAGKTNEAMDWFWQLDEAYVRGRYSLCRQIIQTMEDTAAGAPLKNYLPTESTTDNERFSPYDRYQEIYDALY